MENTLTRRSIPTGRDSTLEQVLENPPGGLYRFDASFTGYGGGAGWVFLLPDQLPGAVLGGELGLNRTYIVVGIELLGQVVSVTDAELPHPVLKNVYEEHAPPPLRMAPQARAKSELAGP
jgi:hypothetical protein